MRFFQGLQAFRRRKTALRSGTGILARASGRGSYRPCIGLAAAYYIKTESGVPDGHVPAPFVPPAPKPRTKPPSTLEMMRIVYRNPLELWGEPSYNEPYISVTGIGGPLVIANDPALIRHVLVDNAKNYKMATVRQMILRPILRDGLLTAEGDVWKRSRKAMAPVFTPRHIFGFAGSPCCERSAGLCRALRGRRRRSTSPST